MGFRRVVAVLVCMAVSVLVAVSVAPFAHSEPDPNSPPVADAAPADRAAPVDDGRMPSAPPATTRTPDGWTLTVSSKDEVVMPVAPLTTALSSRDYVVGGTFLGQLSGPSEPRGILEVGYQIGCGIDMSTSNGVTLGGTAGLTTSLGTTGPFGGAPTGFLPILSFPVSGAITVGLKPGIVNIIPVDKKEFEGSDPWVMISNFHVKIDGCVGQSFIRPYVTLTRQTKQSDVILSWVGVTKSV